MHEYALRIRRESHPGPLRLCLHLGLRTQDDALPHALAGAIA